MVYAKYCCGGKPLVTYTPGMLRNGDPNCPAVYEITCTLCGHKVQVEVPGTYDDAVELWNKSIVE